MLRAREGAGVTSSLLPVPPWGLSSEQLAAKPWLRDQASRPLESGAFCPGGKGSSLGFPSHQPP